MHDHQTCVSIKGVEGTSAYKRQHSELINSATMMLSMFPAVGICIDEVTEELGTLQFPTSLLHPSLDTCRPQGCRLGLSVQVTNVIWSHLMI